MGTEYVKCDYCSFVFKKEDIECPNCKKQYNINESLEDSEPLFNLND